MTEVVCAGCGQREAEAVAEDLGWQRTVWCVPTYWACPACQLNGTGVAIEPPAEEENGDDVKAKP